MIFSRNPSEFDTSDPLGALMTEWRQVTNFFWGGLIIAGILIFSPLPQVAWLLGLAAVGMPLLLLGQSVVIVGNELRKNGRAAPQAPEEAR